MNPDAGTVKNVYRLNGQIRFSQNAQQTVEKKYSYINYDSYNRVIESGEYAYTDNAADAFALNMNPELALNINSCSQRNFMAYDVADPNFIAATVLNANIYYTSFLNGRISKTWNQNAAAWYSYDELGRVKWCVQQLPDVGIKTLRYYYDARSGQIKNITYQMENPDDRMSQYFYYDKDCRLSRVASFKFKCEGGSSGGNATESYSWCGITQHAKYFYYPHGPVKRVELNENLQGIDFVYTINGWLKSINDPNLNTLAPGSFNTDPGKDGVANTAHANFKPDVFGMALDYFKNDYSRNGTYINYVESNTQYYNGNIRAQRWKTNADILKANLPEGKQWMYVYNYDYRSWLTSADFGTYAPEFGMNSPTGSNYQAGTNTGDYYYHFTSAANAYKMWNITYDANGNLLTLNRNAYSGANQATLDMDQFSYIYMPNTNKLSYVADANTLPNGYNDIKPGQNAGNYEYNATGQLIADLQLSQYYKYNAAGKVEAIFADAAHQKKKVLYIYSPNQQVIKKQVYNPANNTLLNTTCYVYNGSSAIATYTKQASETTYHGEYSVHGMGRIATYNDDEQRYHYEINDHLGNVRAVISRNAAGNLEVLQATDYYPWGMEMPGRQQVASHAYRYGYQGQFAEYDPESGMNHFELRQYDAALGRWFAPDPYRQHHSPYMAMGNNWPNGVDPDGGWEFTIFGITIKYTKHKHKVGNGRGHWDIDCSWSISSGGAAPDYGSCSLSDFDFSWAGYSGYSSSYDGSVYSSGYGGGGDYDYDQDDYHSNNNDGVDGHITHMKQQIEDGRLFPFATLQDDGEALQEQFARDRIKDDPIKPNAYYVLQYNKATGFGHALIYFPEQGVAYEANHPNNGNISGLTSSRNGGEKACVYKWSLDLKRPDLPDNAPFWNYGIEVGENNRHNLMISPVYLPNLQAAINWCENAYLNENWDYNFFTNNCKHFVMQGLKAGGFNVGDEMSDPAPKGWPYPFTQTINNPYK